jgi:hypothetical protein
MILAPRCYCGNQLDQRAAPKAGILGNCNMKCVGDASSNCGGSKAITLYQKCDAGACTNSGSNTGGSTGPPASGNSPSPSHTAPLPSDNSPSPFSSSPLPTGSAPSPSPVSPVLSSEASPGSSSTTVSTYNDAVTGGPSSTLQSTFITVPKSGVTSKSQLHTRLRTTVITSVVTETYWAR